MFKKGHSASYPARGAAAGEIFHEAAMHTRNAAHQDSSQFVERGPHHAVCRIEGTGRSRSVMIDGDTHSAVDSEVAMGRSPEPELQADNEGLAKLCLWEADRTLD